MFVRFVIARIDKDSHCLTGVFRAAAWLQEQGTLDAAAEKRIEQFLCWFNQRLPVPNRFARSRRPRAHPNAICWFKTTAREFLDKVRELTALLARHGLPTQTLQTQRPGYVVYEDEYQVVAVPFRDTLA